MGTRANTFPAPISTPPPRTVHFVEPPLIQPARQVVPTARDSITATVLMLFYVGIYIAAGFAALSALRWAWLRFFG